MEELKIVEAQKGQWFTRLFSGSLPAVMGDAREPLLLAATSPPRLVPEHSSNPSSLRPLRQHQTSLERSSRTSKLWPLGGEFVRTIKSMIKELELAGIVEKTGQKIVVKSDLYKCLDGGASASSIFPHPGPPKESGRFLWRWLLPWTTQKARKKPLELQRPNPGSINGIWEKLKTH